MTGDARTPNACCDAPSGPPPQTPSDEAQLRKWLQAETEPDPEAIVALLDEAHPLYSGLGSLAVTRIRGALLLALAGGPLPADAFPFVLEELESPNDAYLTAAAAYTLRAAAAPDATFVEPLLTAARFIRLRDDIVRLSQYGGYGREGETTTAVAEVLATLAWLGGHAEAALEPLRDLRDQEASPAALGAIDAVIAHIEASPKPAASCCASTPAPSKGTAALQPAELASIELQDQDGVKLLFGDYFIGQPSIVVFFYTRCENAMKCPVTITKLGHLQRLMREQQLESHLHTAAITYDPAFDLPPRLEQYRRSWGAERGPGHRLLRTTGDFEGLRAYFGLGVNYGPTIVNRHRIEATVLDAEGRIAHRSTRFQWDEREVLARAAALL